MPKLIADQMAAQLRDRIDAGEWQATGRLPTERELALQFGVARNTVRRAVSLLADEGIVSRQVGRGTFLAGSGAGSFGAIIARIQGTSPADLMDVRLLLEPATAAAAATTASDAQLEAIRQAHQAAVAATDMPTFEDRDADFHQRIFDCTRNELLKEILRDYRYIEHYGMGVRNRIINSIWLHNGTEPDLVEEDDRFMVRLWKAPQ